jgi:hypothetical protein
MPPTTPRRVAATLAGLAVAVVGAGGCGGAGIPDLRIVNALNLEQTGRGYEMGGDPFCTIAQLLNDADEVSQADAHPGAAGFVIAGRGGEVGVLARRPFAPDCSRRAERALTRLSRRSE